MKPFLWLHFLMYVAAELMEDNGIQNNFGNVVIKIDIHIYFMTC